MALEITRVPENDRIARLVKPSLFDSQRNMANPEVFHPRPQDVGEGSGVSYNWMDFFDCADDVSKLLKIRSQSQLTLKASNRFAFFNVGDALEKVNGLLVDEKSEVIHEPIPATERCGPDESRCLMTKIPMADNLIGLRIAEELAELARLNNCYSVAELESM